MLENRHSYYPVCDETADDIVGILSERDYLRLKDKSRQTVLEKAVRPPQFVPESVRTDVLFRNMQKNRNHFAVVLDEYGGMSGIVTMNDLLEQLVGDLEDDDTVPPEAPLIERLDDGAWSVSGAAPLDEVQKAVAVPLPVDEYETFGGLVFSLLGEVPEDGETPSLREFGLDIRVTEVREHRLEKAMVSLAVPAGAKPGEDSAG